MRLIWNAGAAIAITAMLTSVASLGSDPKSPAIAGSRLIRIADPAPDMPPSRDLPHRHYSGLSEHFQAANLSHDGRLTAAQAGLAGWTRVVRHFGEIDSNRAGFVTQAQIHDFNVAHRHGRRTGDEL